MLDEYKNSGIIIIDECKENDNIYYILCFDNIVLLIPQEDIIQLSTFFSNNRNSSIYFISINFSNSIEQFKYHGGPDFLHYIKNTNELSFFRSRIINFIKNFAIQINENIINNHTIEQLNKIWEIIKKFIAGYLIQKAILKTNIDRYTFFDQSANIKKISENETISLGIIGKGNLSFIEMIYHIIFEEVFVIKVFSDPDESMKLYDREKNNYLIINHPFLLRYYGTFEENLNKNLIIEYINGKTLHFIKGMKFNDNDKLKCIFEILIVMKYLHDKGFIYRDLRPNNIMIDQNKTAILIDYDRMVKSNNQISLDEITTDFTDVFIAPEISSGEAYSYKSDIYSLGILIYFILTEERPKNDEFENIIIEENIFSQEFKKIEEIVRQCILEPEKRPTISSILKIFIEYYFIKLLDIYEGNIQRTIIFLKIAAENNQSDAQYILGSAYLTGKDIPYDLEKSFYYYFSSAYNNHYLAQFDLGNIYYEGIYVPQNIQMAIKYFTLAANQNLAQAQFNLGIIYHCEKDYFDFQKALYYYNLAANQNFPPALHTLGKIYFNNEFIERDINKSIYYFSLASDKNYVESQFTLGTLYLEGKLVQRNINKAIKYLSLAANQNDEKAQYNLGIIYLDGKYISRDIQKCIQYLTLSANNYNPQASYILGLIYIDEKIAKQDVNKAIHYLMIAAKQNIADAQFNLGIIYYDGKYIQKDINKSIQYLTLAANQNYQKAINKLQYIYSMEYGKSNIIIYDEKNNPSEHFNLGLLYLEGKSVEKDIKKAIYHLEFAANHNHTEAQLKIGQIYQDGQFISKDMNKSIYYYTLAANKNCREAQYNLGIIYLRGDHVDKDINKGIHYITLAAMQNLPQAQAILGHSYYYGTYGPRDVNKAIYYFTLAADQNLFQAQYMLGDIFYCNEHIQRDTAKSIHYFLLVSNNNHPQSQFCLGKIYFNEKNYEKGIYYYSLAAKNNHCEAQSTLGDIFYAGDYTKRDVGKAIYYYTLASKNNDKKAINNLGSLYYEGIYVPRDVNKALSYYQLGANLNDPCSQYNLGKIFLEGIDVPQNINKAIYYLEMAAKQNDTLSQIKLGSIYSNLSLGHIDLKKALYYNELAAKNNDPNAQYILGMYYYQTGQNQHDINKGVNYLIQSSKNRYKSSYYPLGFVYHYDKNIKTDIKKAILYYKEASSFNNQYAKNNLGVIYKNGYKDEVEKNIGFAVEYFKEAIHQKSDPVSMYNLALTYIYDIKTEIDESIKLLTESTKKGFSPSLELLCIILIKKIGYQASDLRNEIQKYSDLSNSIIDRMMALINDKIFIISSNLEERYKFYQYNEYIYNFKSIPIPLKNAMVKETNIKLQNKLQNINSSFYEGFNNL